MRYESLDEKYAKSIILKLFEEKSELQITKFLDIVNSYKTIKEVVKKLEEEGLVKTEEKVIGRKTIYVSLTEKGRAVAEKLKEAEEIVKMNPEELEAERKRLHWFVDINTYADHITAYDIHDGKKEIFNVWLKPNGKYLLLYCDRCNSYNCRHVDWAIHDPVIGECIKEIAKKKGLKIKYLEDEKKEE